MTPLIYLLAIVLGFVGIVFIVGAQGQVIRIVVGVVLFAAAGVLVVKQRAGRQIVVVDAGMTDLIRPALYDAYHPIVPLQAHSATDVLSDVVGPVCESADADHRSLITDH